MSARDKDHNFAPSAPNGLKNTDYLVWHVARHKRLQRAEEIKQIFSNRERVRSTHH